MSAPTPVNTTPAGHTVCQGSATVLDTADAEHRLRALPGWQLQDGRLVRTFHCRTFRESITFVQSIAETAEAINHHPNLSVEDKRRVGIVLWTHKLDGLTALDFDLAARIDVLHRDLAGTVA